MVALDTNVFVYAVDIANGHRRAIAMKLISDCAAAGDAILLWQVAVEFMAKLRGWENAGRIQPGSADVAIDMALTTFPLVTPSATTLSVSRQLYRRYSLSHWDALIVAACIESNITTLDTEDLAAGASFDGVTILNPFTLG
jgi:predicted nucleic acid-binding protein